MNLEGSDYWGRPYVPAAAARTVSRGEVRAFVIATAVPKSAAGSTIAGTATLLTAQGGQHKVSLELAVSGAALRNGGDDERWRGTRVQWLNSKLVRFFVHLTYRHPAANSVSTSPLLILK